MDLAFSRVLRISFQTVHSVTQMPIRTTLTKLLQRSYIGFVLMMIFHSIELINYGIKLFQIHKQDYPTMVSNLFKCLFANIIIH